MAKHKLTKARLRYLIKDEHKAAKEYRSYGLKTLASNESHHAKVLTRKLRNF